MTRDLLSCVKIHLNSRFSFRQYVYSPWQNTIHRKFTGFRGRTAAVFRHTTYSGRTETIHQGIIFIAKNNFISLTCVYPADAAPSPAFEEFIESFRILTALTPGEAEQIDQLEQLASPDP